MNEEREKIVNKLVKLGVFVTREHAYVVADFIISDRARILKPLTSSKHFVTGDPWHAVDSINETLKLSGLKYEHI